MLDSIEQNIREMESEEIVERLEKDYFTEAARSIAEEELRNRGVNPENPILDEEQNDDDDSDFSLSDLPLWRQLVTFRGRASRLKFWIVESLGSMLLIILEIFLEVLIEDSEFATALCVIPVAGLIVVAIWANLVQRCHDRNKSGCYVFLLFIPLIGQLWALVELGCLPGTPGPNRFGKATSNIGENNVC